MRASALFVVLAALTTDGYEREGTLANCAQIANEAKQRWGKTGELPHDLRTLRSCLFFEQRRAHHSGDGFNGRTLAYVRALVEEMRTLLSHPAEPGLGV